MNDNYNVLNEIEYLDTISSSDEDRYKAFITYLIDKVSAKTEKTKVNRKNIAEKSGINRAYLDKSKYSNLGPGNLSKISRTFHFSLEETIELYYRLGRCLNIDNEFDKSIIGDQEIPENLRDRIGHEVYIDCLFDLIKKEHVYSLCDKEKTDNVIELIDSGQKEAAYDCFKKMLRQDGARHHMYIELRKSKPDTVHKRQTLFEIGYFCGFTLNEIKRLYMSQGYSFAPEYIVFDAFAYNIMKYEKNGHPSTLYKSVFSNMKEKIVNFDRTDPDIKALIDEFSMRYVFHDRTKDHENEFD